MNIMNLVLLTFGIMILIVSTALIIKSLLSEQNNYIYSDKRESSFKVPMDQEIERRRQYLEKDDSNTIEHNKEVGTYNKEQINDIEEMLEIKPIKQNIAKKNIEEYEAQKEYKSIDITQTILKMYNEGIDISEIAKKFDKGVREVETIIRVNEKSK